MSDEAGEKTEEPTPRKRQESRDEGQVPKSQELSAAVSLLGLALVLGAVLPKAAQQLLAVMGSGLAAAGDPAFTSESAAKMLQAQGGRAMSAILMIALSMAGIALAINAAQARGVLSTKPLAPKWERVSPLANIKRMFGMQAVAELLKSVVKVVIVGLAINAALGPESLSAIVATAQQSPVALMYVVKHYTVKLVLTAGLAYLGLALADYGWQYWQHLKQIRMTKEEVKQEMKNSEGDPLLKQRMRSIARGMARRQMFRDVPKADVVIANPTHRAIALRYDPLQAPAPIVLAMGQRKVAERIKKIALDHGVPVIENRPLAIALLASAKVGMMIPADLYLAVAEVLAFVMRQRRERGLKWGYQPVSHLVGDSA